MQGLEEEEEVVVVRALSSSSVEQKVPEGQEVLGEVQCH